MEAQEAVLDSALEPKRGIRYGFVREILDGKDEAIDIKKFSGNWSEIQLEIESNVSGYLYVLTDLGKGKWQFVRPESLNLPVSSSGAITVKPYQPVIFPLSRVTNTLGKLVVSSITVLLSSTPLKDLGRWLGGEGNQEQFKIRLKEREGSAVFVVNVPKSPGGPFHLEITLGKDN